MAEQASLLDISKTNIVTTTLNPGWKPGKLQWQPGYKVTDEIIDKVRGDLAIDMVRAGVEKGARVIVIEGTNIWPFREALVSQGALVFRETAKGISPSRQQGFRISQAFRNTEAHLWTEPEKVSLIKDCLDPLIIPLFTGEADIIIPSRDAESFSTYPTFQADLEQEGNMLWNNLLKAEGIIPNEHPGFDNMFGPRSWHRDMTELFLRKYKSTDPDAKLLKPDEYANALHFPVINALLAGKTVLSIPAPFKYPEVQKEIEQVSPEFRIKRKYQLVSIIETAKEFLAFARGESSRLVLA